MRIDFNLQRLEQGCARLTISKFVGIAFACLILLSSIFTNSALALDLRQASKLALINDAEYQAARHAYEAESKKLRLAVAAFYPSLSFSAEYTQTFQEIVESDSFLYQEGKSKYAAERRTLSLTQPIYQKLLSERFKLARSRLQEAKFVLQDAEQRLMLRMAESYFRVLAARSDLTVSRAELREIELQLQVVSEQHEQGLVSRSDQLDVAARLSAVKAEEIELSNKLEDAIFAAKVILGRYLGNLSDIRPYVEFVSPELSRLGRWLDDAKNFNASLKAKGESVTAAAREVDVRESSRLPTVGIEAAAYESETGGATFGDGGNEIRAAAITLNFKLPLYSGGRVRSEIEEASDLYFQAKEEQRHLSRNIERQTRDAFHGLRSHAAKISALKQSIDAHKLALLAKREGYSKGIYSPLDVLTAEKNLSQVRRDFGRARYDYCLTRLQLLQLAGKLGDAEIRLMNAWLTPSAETWNEVPLVR